MSILMKKLIYLIILLFFGHGLYAQNRISIKAFVLNSKTQKPIEYVNIGFLNKSIGTVSNSKGLFNLKFDENKITETDKLQFSVIGYETKQFTLPQLFKILSDNNKLYLNPINYVLEEVFLKNEKRKKIHLGNKQYNLKKMGYWKDNKGLGGEIATRIIVKKKRTRLLNLSFNIIENLSDSLLIRINVYQYKKRYPQENVLNKNIYHTISKKKGVETINLKPYNIIVSNDIVVSIELIEVYGKDIGFAISSSFNKGVSYLRTLSQDKWKRLPDTGMGFNLLSSYPSQNEAISDKKREKPKKITLYWDVSLNMKKRKIEEELNLLLNYLKRSNYPEVEAVKFSSGHYHTNFFQTSKNQIKNLLNYLKNAEYNGSTDYSKILKNNNFNAETVLLFTNGNAKLTSFEPEIYVPIFCVNSQDKSRHKILQDLSYYSDGHYINLEKNSIKQALNFMLFKKEDRDIYEEFEMNSKKKGSVYGTIFTESGSIQGATVEIRDTFLEVRTDSEGVYVIGANMGDILVVNYLGMLQKEVLVSNTKRIDIELLADGELLEEVVLKGQISKDSITTAYGKKSSDAIGYAVDQINREDIKPYHHSLAQLLSGRVGVTVRGFGVNAKFFFNRSSGSSFNLSTLPVIVIDHMVYTQDDNAYPIIDPQNIDNIAILKSTIASNRYGSIANSGAIVITTKYAVRAQNKKNKVSALVKGNDYTEKLNYINKVFIKPNYILELEKATSFKGAQTIYKRQQQAGIGHSIQYYIEVSDYFSRWDSNFSYSLLTNIAEIAPTNPKALKVLAYKLEELGKINEAKDLYKRIAKLRPKQAQSYRDLALIYQNSGAYKKAFSLYTRMLGNDIEGVDFSGLQEIIENELRHLLAFHKSKVNFSALPNTLLNIDFKRDIRIIFDWTDSNTEFEIQFVNPQKKYFTWHHDLLTNKDLMSNEIKQGFGSEEFIIDDAEPGEWLINIKYLGKEALKNPTFLKYTLYRNYGLPNESRTVKTIKLYQYQEKVTLDSFLY